MTFQAVGSRIRNSSARQRMLKQITEPEQIWFLFGSSHPYNSGFLSPCKFPSHQSPPIWKSGEQTQTSCMDRYKAQELHKCTYIYVSPASSLVNHKLLAGSWIWEVLNIFLCLPVFVGHEGAVKESGDTHLSDQIPGHDLSLSASW